MVGIYGCGGIKQLSQGIIILSGGIPRIYLIRMHDYKEC